MAIGDSDGRADPRCSSGWLRKVEAGIKEVKKRGQLANAGWLLGAGDARRELSAGFHCFCVA